MSFDPNDPRITAYVLGELKADERAAFESALSASGDLRQAVEATRHATEQIACELQAEPLASLSGPQRESVLRAARDGGAAPVGRGQITPRPAQRRRKWAVFGGAAIAASLLGVCWGGYLLHRAAGERQQVAVLTHTAASAGYANARSEPLRRDLAVASASSPSSTEEPAPASRDPSSVRPQLAELERIHKRTDASSPEASTRGRVQEKRFADAYHRPVPAPYGGAAAANGAAPETRWDYGYEMDADGHPGMMGGGLPGPEGQRADHGRGPGLGGDQYLPIVENPFREVKSEPLSTFSIDVDTASYSKVRMVLMQQGVLPRPDAVRIEELVNYFTYDYAPPSGDQPFAAHLEVAECPWAPGHRLVRAGIKGKEIQRDQRPTSNLVFLLDVSGSMDQPNKLPLVKHGMKLLVDQLGENDRVAIVVYAGAAGMVLDSTTGDRKQVILDALDRLHAGGSTNGGEGIRLAYQAALDHFVRGGVNRVILCTDGDFNVGVTGMDQLVRIAEQNGKTGVFLSVLGFGMGNHNDAMLEQISDKGNGNYAFIDTEAEARKVLIEQMTGTLITIAKDVKIQVEFNPQRIAAYRLIGYENRILAAQDFNDDKKDAGEIGAGHTVTALYEIVPAGADGGVSVPPVDELKYQQKNQTNEAAGSGELLTLKMRYKQPDGDTSSKLEFPLRDEGRRFGQASKDFRFAASVAAFGMLLRDSAHKGNASYAGVQEIAAEAASDDTSGYRDEFLKMLAKAKELAGQ